MTFLDHYRSVRANDLFIGLNTIFYKYDTILKGYINIECEYSSHGWAYNDDLCVKHKMNQLHSRIINRIVISLIYEHSKFFIRFICKSRNEMTIELSDIDSHVAKFSISAYNKSMPYKNVTAFFKDIIIYIANNIHSNRILGLDESISDLITQQHLNETVTW